MSNNVKTFSLSHFMYILDSTCQDIKKLALFLIYVFCVIVILLKIYSHFQKYYEVYINTANVPYLCRLEKVGARNLEYKTALRCV